MKTNKINQYMRINKIQPNINNNRKTNEKSFKGIERNVLRAFESDALISTLSLEIPCSTGRGVNAYKRGGFPEFRERATDDTVSAIFWLKGVDIFNKLGDSFGKHVLKLPETEFDVGKDALRTPFENLVKDKSADLGDKAREKLSKKLAAFKFTKVLSSAVLAAVFMGVAVPKINQAITKRMLGKDVDKSVFNQEKDNKYTILKQSRTSFEEFDKKISKGNSPSFKGIPLTKVAYLMENNAICKMLSCDAGMITGRVKTARNADEGREYLFRDTASAFFYYASVPLIYNGLQKAANSSALTGIDSVCAKQITENFKNVVKSSGGSIGVKEFTEKTIGKLSAESEEIISKLPFESDVISVRELSKHLKDSNLMKKAVKMSSKLQPEHAVLGKVLTRQQVADVLKNGSVNTPEFMETIYKSRFKGDLTNPYKYIPMKKITTFRDNIDKYTQKITETAVKENGGIIDVELLNRINKKSFKMSAAFRAVAIGISALALGVMIPKIQYAITAKKTGVNAAPGLREFETSETKK